MLIGLDRFFIHQEISIGLIPNVIQMIEFEHIDIARPHVHVGGRYAA